MCLRPAIFFFKVCTMWKYIIFKTYSTSSFMLTVCSIKSSPQLPNHKILQWIWVGFNLNCTPLVFYVTSKPHHFIFGSKSQYFFFNLRNITLNKCEKNLKTVTSDNQPHFDSGTKLKWQHLSWSDSIYVDGIQFLLNMSSYTNQEQWLLCSETIIIQ